MDKDIKKLIKLLQLKNRSDLADLLSNTTSEIRMSGQFGSQWNSILSDFVIYCPVEKYIETKKLKKEEIQLLLDLVNEIYPVENDAPEIIDINFRISDEDATEVSNNNENPNEAKTSFIDKSIRVFISYSSTDGHIAGKVKNCLEKYFGLEVFLAHEDISGGDEWEQVIIENLKSTDIFIPLLSPNFEDSLFTDQETGMAIVLAKRIIPVCIFKGSTPHGFIKKIQALKLELKEDNSQNWIEFGHKLIEIVANNQFFKNSTKNSIIRAFKGSNSFSFAREMVHILRRYKPFNKDQSNQILRAYLENINLSEELYQVPSFIKEIISENIQDIDDNLKGQLPQEMIPKVQEITDVPF